MDGSPTFGAWLRRRRKALDLTQAELAHAVGCVVGMIKSIEADTRRPSRQLAGRIADCLALSQDERMAFISAARGLSTAEQLSRSNRADGDPVAPRRAWGARSMPLPGSTTALIGREGDLAEIGALLADSGCRLVTVVGPGGIGKTRLALAVAERAEGFADGAAFVPLAAVSAPEFLTPAILSAFDVIPHGQRESHEQLLDLLRARELLLVLDNLEQLLGAGDDVAGSVASLLLAILHAAPRVKLLVTSRERLRLPGEWLFDLAGLHSPSDESIAELERSSAARLFVQRARQVRRQFALADSDARAVMRICQLVEGMPLAIELAAAGMRGQSASAIADALEVSMSSLVADLRAVPERHRSITATFEHSWRLLSDTEQGVLARLSVFRGGFDDAAAQIAQATPRILTRLIDKSLLRWDGVRYEMHELLRQYAAQKLAEAGDLSRVGNQHLAYFCRMAEQGGQGLYGPQQAAWRERLDRELGNLRAALEWSLEWDVQAGLRLAGDLDRYWEIYRPGEEGTGWLGQILRHPGASLPNTARARALLALSGLLAYTSRTAEAQLLAEESLALAQSLGDGRGVARARYLLGVIVDYQEGRAAGIPFVTESLEHARAIGDAHSVASALGWLGGAIYRLHRDYAQARVLYDGALALLRELGDGIGIIQQLNDTALTAIYNRDFGHALACLREAQELRSGLRLFGDMANITVTRGQLALHEGRYDEAQRCFEESLSLCRASGAEVDPWTLANLGYALLRQGERARAAALLAESAQRFSAGPQSIGVAYALEGAASLAVMQGEPRRAARLYAWADALREDVMDVRPPVEQDGVSRDLMAICAQIDAATLAAAQAEGRAMTLDQAVAEAMAMPAMQQSP